MKNYYLLTVAFLITTTIQAQYKELKKLPDGLLTANVMLTTNVDDGIFEELSNLVIEDFQSAGIQVKEKYNMSNNPTKAASQRKEVESIINENDIDIVIGVNFVTFNFSTKNGGYREKQKAFITVAESDIMYSKKPEFFMIKKNIYAKALDALMKQIEKQF